MRFIIRVIINAFAIWVVTLIPALTVTIQAFPWGPDAPFALNDTLRLMLTLLAVAAVFAIVNTVLGTILKVLAFPLFILTLGLITFVINGLLLWVTAWITHFWGWGLTVGAFWWGVVAAIVISLINWFFGIVLRPQRKRV